MKKLISVLTVVLVTVFIYAQRSPVEMHIGGWRPVSSNCKSINLGIVTITTGSISYVRGSAEDGTLETTSVPCSNNDRWHWFWE